MPNTRGNVVARHSRVRVSCEMLPARLNRIENSISCDCVFNGNVGPDFDQVLIGTIRADNRKHS